MTSVSAGERIGIAQRVAKALRGEPFEACTKHPVEGRGRSPIRAPTPDQLSFNDRERQPAVLKAARDRFSGDAAPEADNVKLLGHLPYLLDPPSKARPE